MNTAVTDTDQFLGPVDYLIVEFPPDAKFDGSALHHLLGLVRADIIGVLDLAFFRRDGDTISLVSFEELHGDGSFDAALFAEAHTGILSEDDLGAAGAALEPGRLAAVVVYENRWAAPFAGALRRTGAELVASGRIPVDDLLAVLDATESESD